FALIKDTSFHLTLIGEGPNERALRNMVADLNLSFRIKFLPPLHGETLWDRLRSAYAVVIPSWTEVGPQQAYECLARGVPFLITRENFLPFASALPTVDPESPEQMASAIVALGNPLKYADVKQQLAAIRVRRSWDDVVTEHKAVFRETSGSR